ncbi:MULTISPECIES: DUF6945 domain-containing protein [Enterobacter cloacae complex]|uniref:DUF6945 domain-containing protein n=1 Tax=Enterobacter cloacae complex TaxID=354276 RepID=UPI002FF576FD
MTETVKTEVHHAQNEQDEVQRTPDEAYGVTEMRFLCASRILIRSTGEVVKITDKMKLVYIYMMNQYLGFTSREQQFYTDQRQMAAALDISRDTMSKILAALKTLGIVENAGWKGNSESYTVHFFSDVADGLQVIHKEWKGVPAWDHERANKNFKSKKQKPKAEESGKNEQKQQQNHKQQPSGVASGSATDDLEQQSGVSQSAGDSGNAVSSDDDAVNERYYADLNTLNYWQNQGQEGLEEYLTMWGKTSKEAQTLIKSHITILHSQGSKGSRSAANDESSGADAIYKQQQARRAAESKQAINAPQQQEDEQLEFDDNEAF